MKLMKIPRALFLLLLPALGGCANLPRDCDGSTMRIRQSKVFEVGTASEQNTAAYRAEKQIVERVAAQLGATVRWREGNALDLMHRLEKRELPLVVASVRDDSPYATGVGMSKPFLEEGETRLCIAVAPGENELLLLVDQTIAASKNEVR